MSNRLYKRRKRRRDEDVTEHAIASKRQCLFELIQHTDGYNTNNMVDWKTHMKSVLELYVHRDIVNMIIDYVPDNVVIHGITNQVDSGMVVCGQRQGEWKSKHILNSAIHTMTYVNDIAHGKYTRDGHGYRMQVDFVNGLPHGLCTTVLEPSGVVYRATYRHGLIHGVVTKQISDNMKGVSTYRNGELHGQCVEYAGININGMQLRARPYMIRNYKNNVLDGLTYRRDHTNCYTLTEYRNGLKHGFYREYDRDGTMRVSSRFHQGQLHGLCRKWDVYPLSKKRLLVEKCYYAHGRLHGTMTMFKYDRLHGESDSGEPTFLRRMKHQGDYVHGKRHGLHVFFNHENDTRTETNYVLGIRHGIQRSYYSSGQLSCEMIWINGELVGDERQWNESGELTRWISHQEQYSRITWERRLVGDRYQTIVEFGI